MYRFFIILLIVGVSYGKDLGVFGNVYPIAEKDIVEELKEKAKNLDYERIRKEYKKKIENYRPPDLVSLPKAKRSRIYTHIPWAVVPEDVWGVKNGKLVLLYPKGSKFNPLKALPYKPIDLLIFNGKDRGEVRFVKENFLKKGIRVAYLLTDGSYVDISRDFGLPVYYFSSPVERLGVKETVSRVTVEGDHLLITVFAVDSEGKLKDRDYVVEDGFLKKKVLKAEK